MRDPTRIDKVMYALHAYWLEHPDLRLCQIVGNMLNDLVPTEPHPRGSTYLMPPAPPMNSCGYNVEDELVLDWLGRDRS